MVVPKTVQRLCTGSAQRRVRWAVVRATEVRLNVEKPLFPALFAARECQTACLAFAVPEERAPPTRKKNVIAMQTKLRMLSCESGRRAGTRTTMLSV